MFLRLKPSSRPQLGLGLGQLAARVPTGLERSLPCYGFGSRLSGLSFEASGLLGLWCVCIPAMLLGLGIRQGAKTFQAMQIPSLQVASGFRVLGFAGLGRLP